MTTPVGAITFADLEIMARTIFGEARSEGILGMEAVAAVIMNRYLDQRWPESLAEVCQQPNQFSCWNSNDVNRRHIVAVAFADENFRKAYAIAAATIAGLVEDRTGGANHHLNPRLVSRAKWPTWAKDELKTVSIGNHDFYVV